MVAVKSQSHCSFDASAARLLRAALCNLQLSKHDSKHCSHLFTSNVAYFEQISLQGRCGWMEKVAGNEERKRFSHTSSINRTVAYLECIYTIRWKSS